MKFIRSHLSIKLFFSYFAVIVVGMAVVALTTGVVTPQAYARHLFFMEQELGSGMGMGQGHGQGGMMSDFYANFQATFNESLLIAVLAASATALIVSFFFSQRILGPVNVMKVASRRIAEGHFDERIRSEGEDELSQMAGSFNRMAEQLEQIENMRRRLIGDVAHELRTPLTAIKGSAEGLIDGVLPATVETFQQIHAESERLSRLVDDLQELSRVESGAIQLDVHPVDLTAAIQTVGGRMRHLFNEKRIALTLNLPGVPTLVSADEDRLIQVLTNLMGNALRYTPEGGKVTVTAAAEKAHALISIRDTGIGIPQDQVARIFERFYRVDKSRARPGGGSGIGLTIAMHLVEAHGGRIWAESPGENKGSAFLFTLPLAG